MHALRLILRRRNIPASSGVQRPRRLYSTSTRTCPSCSAPLRSPLPTCLRCSYIQPLPSELTYYDILGVSNTSQNLFKVDVRDLKKKFLEAQRVCHPDAWSGKGEKEQSFAASQSSVINEAFKTLSSPLLRAQYILTLQGIPPQETDKLENREFVMEVMEDMESVEATDNPDQIEAIRKMNAVKITELHDGIERAVEAKDWGRLSELAVRLKYLQNIEASAKAKEEEIS